VLQWLTLEKGGSASGLRSVGGRCQVTTALAPLAATQQKLLQAHPLLGTCSLPASRACTQGPQGARNLAQQLSHRQPRRAVMRGWDCRPGRERTCWTARGRPATAPRPPAAAGSRACGCAACRSARARHHLPRAHRSMSPPGPAAQQHAFGQPGSSMDLPPGRPAASQHPDSACWQPWSCAVVTWAGRRTTSLSLRK